MEELVKAAQAKIDERLKSSQKDLATLYGGLTIGLDEHAERIKAQLNELSTLKVPGDMLRYYLETGGLVWVSKNMVIDSNFSGHLSLLNRNNNILYHESFMPKKGLYKIVLIAVPQKVEPDKKVQVKDDYDGYILE